MRMTAVAPEKSTEVVLSKVASALSTKWTAVSDKALQTDVPSSFPSGVSPDATRAAYVQAMQQVQFPTTIAAANSAVSGIPPNSFYVSYLQGKSNAGMSGQMESAVCLYMILSASQGGVSFNINNLSPNEVGVEPSTGLKYVKDGWGQPVSLSAATGPAVTSAGPDKTFGTVDDITVSRQTGQTNINPN